MKSPAFSLYVRDILCSKTIRKLHSKPGVRGLAYLYLLCESWLEEPPATLPNDPDELAAMARVSPKEWAELWPLIEEQFQVRADGRLFNPRLMHTWENQQKNYRNGRKGGRPRNPNHNPTANPKRNPNRKLNGGPVAANADADADANANLRASKASHGERCKVRR